MNFFQDQLGERFVANQSHPDPNPRKRIGRSIQRNLDLLVLGRTQDDRPRNRIRSFTDLGKAQLVGCPIGRRINRVDVSTDGCVEFTTNVCHGSGASRAGGDGKTAGQSDRR